MTTWAANRRKDFSRSEQSIWMRRVDNFSENRLLQFFAGVYAIIWLLLAISPRDRTGWMLENVLIIAFLAAVIFTYKKFTFTNRSYILMAAFLVLHTIGAHYSYQSTPVDAIMKNLFHSTRGNYDRVVHFFFGVLFVLPIYEVLLRVSKTTRLWAYGLAIAVVTSAGALYEIGEMWVALLASKKTGDQFLGMQGDPWDSQHDMELAVYGAILTVVVTLLVQRRKAKKADSS